MKVYLDIIFIINFLFDFLLLITVGVVLRRTVTIKKILLGSLIGGISIFTLFLPLSSLTLFLIKILISILMVITTFKYRDIRYTLYNLFYLYTGSLILGGGLYLLNVQFSYRQEGLIFYHNGLSINFILLLILSPIIIYAYIKQAKILKNNYSNYYNVDIYLKDGNKTSLSAFLDTGNKLYDPYQKRPIILVNQKLFKYDYDLQNTVLVPYDTVNDHGLMKCIIPNKIDIVGVGIKRNVLIGLVNNKIKIDGVDCILHTALMEG